MVIQLTEVERLKLMQPVRGQGGFQNLLRALQRRCDANGKLRVSDEQKEQIVRYAKDYGEGEFQGRLPMDRILVRKRRQEEMF